MGEHVCVRVCVCVCAVDFMSVCLRLIRLTSLLALYPEGIRKWSQGGTRLDQILLQELMPAGCKHGG